VVLVTDRQSYGITSRQWTDQGYLRVPGRVARTGIQQYLASELQLNDRKPNEIVNVYRPPEEVFSADSLKSYEDVDVTDDHPGELVSADSYKSVAVGHTTDAARPEDDRYVVVDLIVKDKNAIQAVEDGKVSLSAGYEAQYDYAPGVTEDGEEYDFVQRNIRINHVALVDKARAGERATLFDQSATERSHTMATVTIDGKSVTVGDDATAQLVQQSLDAANKSYKDMEAKAKEYEDEAAKLREEMEGMKAEKDAAIEERDKAKQAASDEAIAERIKAVSDAHSSAVKIAGEDFTCDSTDVATIQRKALEKARPSVAWADKSDAYVKAAWDLEMERSTEDRAAESHRTFGQDMAGLHSNDKAPEGTQAYNQFLSGGKH